MSQTATRFAVRLTAAVAVAGTLVALSPTAPARAAPPPNDAATKAIEISALPQRLTADTREATVDRVKRSCVGGHSVWYRYTPATTGRVNVSTIGSSFDTVLAVYQGATTPRTRLACNDDAADLASAARPLLTAGRQYWIALSSCCGRRSGPGGDLVLQLYPGGTPSIELTLDSAEAGAVSGRLRVHATASCATPSVVYGELQVSQAIGEHVARGRAYSLLRECETVPTEWIIRVDSETGWAFQPGTVVAELYAEAYDGFGEASAMDEDNLSVTANPSGKVRR